MTHDNFCLYPGHQDKICLIGVLHDPEIDISQVQDDIAVCHGCQKFKDVASRGIGRRAADQAIGDAVMKLMQQLAYKNDSLRRTAAQLESTVEQLNLFRGIAEAIARSPNLEKSLRIMLTGATSGDAIGFNRAGVLLVNDYTGALEGRAAVGPVDAEEAGLTWKKIVGVSVKELLQDILTDKSDTQQGLDKAVRRARFSLTDTDNPLIRVLNSDDIRASVLSAENCQGIDMSWWPNVKDMVVVPLVSQPRVLGLVVADNAITNKPFSGESIEAFRSLVNACAPGIENSILQQELFIKLKELERVHDLLRANQKYLVHHERLADIGMLATKIAHEFKIPLVTVGGYARRLKNMAAAGKLNPELLDVIISEIDRLLVINSEILEYSRAPKLNIKECDICDLVTDSLSRLGDRLNGSAIEMDIQFHERNLLLNVDPERMKQVILNLAANAIEAMKNGGRLTIRTRQDNDYIVLEIHDTGEGIADSEIDNLFKLFYTTKPSGSGLGLPVTKKIIEDHGGYINVRSEKGKGTSFYVHLPAKKKEIV